MVAKVVVCQWFALCDHPADGVVRHPILGAVPTCRRCAERMDLRFSELWVHTEKEAKS